MRARLIAVNLLVVLGLALPAGASARRGGGGDEVRVDGVCGGGAKSTLKVKARDGGLEVDVEVEHVRGASAWRLTLVQEGRVMWRGTARPRLGRFELRRGLRDLAGADRVGVTASGPSGVTCRMAATLPGA